MAEKKDDGLLRKMGRALMGKNSRENLTPEQQEKRRKKITGSLGNNQTGS
jgi:hypothetical protein